MHIRNELFHGFSYVRWLDQLIYCLEWTDEPAENVRALCRVQHANWHRKYNRSYAVPTQMQRLTIVDLLQKHTEALGAEADTIRFLLADGHGSMA